MVFGALLKENIRVSVMSVRTNLLRTILTVLIIAFGIMALVGILTAIDSIKHTITKQFATMGANTFTVESRGLPCRSEKTDTARKIILILITGRPGLLKTVLIFRLWFPFIQMPPAWLL